MDLEGPLIILSALSAFDFKVCGELDVHYLQSNFKGSVDQEWDLHYLR